MRITKTLAAFGAVALLGSANIAFSKDKGYCGYVTSATGELVRDSDGHCVRNSAWSSKRAIEECDPDLLPKKAVEKPAVKPVEVVPAPLPVPAPQPRFETINLKAGALFDTNKAAIKPAGQAQLDELAAKLNQVSNVEMIQVIGHTDSRGAAAYNQRLSERRAQSVREYLIGKGVSGSMIQASGSGESQPVASNATADGRALNRRVEVIIRATRQVN